MINEDNKGVKIPDLKVGPDPNVIHTNKVNAAVRPPAPIQSAGTEMITTGDVEKHARKVVKMYETEEQRLEDIKNPPPAENLDDMPPPVEMVPESELIQAPAPQPQHTDVHFADDPVEFERLKKERESAKKPPIKTAAKSKAYTRKPRKRKSRAKKKTTINKNETTPDQ